MLQWDVDELGQKIKMLQELLSNIAVQVQKQSEKIEESLSEKSKALDEYELKKLSGQSADTKRLLLELSDQIKKQADQIQELNKKLEGSIDKTDAFSQSIKRLEGKILKAPAPTYPAKSKKSSGAAVAAVKVEELESNHWAVKSIKLLARDGLLRDPSFEALNARPSFSRYEIALIVAMLLRTVSESGDVAVQYIALVEELSREFRDDINTLNLRVDAIAGALENQTEQLETMEKLLRKIESEEASFREAITILDRETVINKKAMSNLFGGFFTRQDGRIRVITLSRATQKDDNALEGRFRITFLKKKSENFAFVARLATGRDVTPGLSDTRFGDSVSNKTFSLDQLYGRWRLKKGVNILGLKMKPKKGLDFYIGKFPNPFVHTEMTWDYDYQPEGMAQVFKFGKYRNFGDLSFRAAQFSLAQSGTAKDSWVQGSQVTVDRFVLKKFGGSAALYDVANPQTLFDGIYVDNSIQGNLNNSTLDLNSDGIPDRFKADGFRMLDLIAGFQSKVNGNDFSLLYNFAKNLDAGSTGKGRRYEMTLGSIKRVRGFKFAYIYQELDPDAVLSPFSDAEFGGSDTRRQQV